MQVKLSLCYLLPLHQHYMEHVPTEAVGLLSVAVGHLCVHSVGRLAARRKGNLGLAPPNRLSGLDISPGSLLSIKPPPLPFLLVLTLVMCLMPPCILVQDPLLHGRTSQDPSLP